MVVGWSARRRIGAPVCLSIVLIELKRQFEDDEGSGIGFAAMGGRQHKISNNDLVFMNYWIKCTVGECWLMGHLSTRVSPGIGHSKS